MKPKNNQTQPQMDMDLKLSGIPFLQRLRFRSKKMSRLLDQFIYWRSALLWFVIFINTALPLLMTAFLYKHIRNLPSEVILLHFSQDTEYRFINTSDLTIVILVNLFIQCGAAIIGSKLYFKLKQVSILILLCSILSAILTYISIYKTLMMFLL
ncbi:MAG: hypothetical protein U9Q67_01650 [Patescibacteria group bacterium]|nr:hypothetical protein [Patescibacteria group bacterium]